MDRKRINDALDRHLRTAAERPSPSTSRGAKPKPPSAAAPKPKGILRPPSRRPSTSSAALLYLITFVCAFGAAEQLDSDSSDEGGSAGGSSEADDTFWINWFCAMRGNEFFAEVDDDYIQDDFNLCGLSAQVPYYDHALDLILDLEPVQEDVFADDQNELVVASAEMLYGLIHARYILTTKGLAAMLEKFKNCDFGRCPRVSCSGQPCLPMGQSDIARTSTVKIYCPKCEDLYYPRSKHQANTDGAYFGTTFPHMFMMTHSQLKPQKPAQQYVPRIFGFKVQKKT
ncbi:putative casein kinase II subunit beta-4 isoform X1 [Hordeum vulgare subsp. vulgare]|uniref:putative casein kinase II subunit beta-4 isoform X1 n=1 Tax=Hordeum vulgare subsp. vulgare TaxID=112509 RepID=UPI001D1A3BB6|nr:putative casein kinase II subunit beta-4 isoform X1 [Hordeum vulgare subsp. vulgare]